MVVKNRYVSKFPKYQKSGIAVISVRKNVLPQHHYNTRQLCAKYEIRSITKFYSVICTSLRFSHSAEG